MAVVSKTLSSRRLVAPARKQPRSRSGRTASYRPYHRHGEAVLLLCLTIVGVIWMMAPVALVIKLLGSIGLFLVLPASLIKQYWPRHTMRDFGWQPPQPPRQPHLYSMVTIAICFWPVALWLLAGEPGRYVAVVAGDSWLAWFFGQSLMIIMLTTQAAWFTGILLFRMTHLIPPWLAMVSIGLILGVANLLVPGPVRYFGVPLTLALVWMAWQTRSFVPPAVAMIGITLVFDLIVRLT